MLTRRSQPGAREKRSQCSPAASWFGKTAPLLRASGPSLLCAHSLWLQTLGSATVTPKQYLSISNPRRIVGIIRNPHVGGFKAQGLGHSLNFLCSRAYFFGASKNDNSILLLGFITRSLGPGQLGIFGMFSVALLFLDFFTATARAHGTGCVAGRGS